MNEELPTKTSYAKWWILTLVLIVFSTAMLAFTGAIGSIFSKRVEREVLVTSHQYREARSSEMVTYEAQLAELRGQLNRKDLTESDKARIQGQVSSINILLSAARNK